MRSGLQIVSMNAMSLQTVSTEHHACHALAEVPTCMSVIPLQAVPMSSIFLPTVPMCAIHLQTVPMSVMTLKTVPMSDVSMQAVPMSVMPCREFLRTEPTHGAVELKHVISQHYWKAG